jgi:transposase-like protein
MISFPGGSCQDRHAPECVRWYVVSSLSERQLEALMQAWGVWVEHSTITHGVLTYGPPLEDAFHCGRHPE